MREKINITEPDDPLIEIAIRIRSRFDLDVTSLIKVEECAESYISGTTNWFLQGLLERVKSKVDAG